MATPCPTLRHAIVGEAKGEIGLGLDSCDPGDAGFDAELQSCAIMTKP
jgi:hypothetical protein